MDKDDMKGRSYNHLSQHGLPTSFESSRHQSWSKKKFQKLNSMTSITIQKLFNKQIEIYNDNYHLPCVNTLFNTSSWQVEELQKIKKELNDMKNQLNDFNIVEWRSHTKKRNYAEDIKWNLRKDVHPEFFTQAWCKFYEMVSSFPLIPEESMNSQKKLKTIHLCEAPGAFVASLNHWLKLNSGSVNWNWTATSLNPYYEGNSLFFMLNDDRFIMHTLDHWYFGADNTGNLMKEVNLNGFIEYEQSNRDEIMLITADGSIDCINVPDEQETIVSHLHFCETITALNLLHKNGNFLLKLFTIFEYKTICLVYLLTCCFNQVIFKKPATSKAGNSEVYIICLGFKGLNYVESHLKICQRYFEKDTDLSMFRKCDIPQSFIEQIVQLGEYFKAHQCEVILNNIQTFNSDDEFYHVKKVRKAVADYFFKIYKLSKLPAESMKIVDANKLLKSSYKGLWNSRSFDSYNERQRKEKMEPVERLLTLTTDLHDLPTLKEVYLLEFKNEFKGIHLIIGTPYEEIQSSKFCEPQLLKIFSSIIELMNYMGLNWQYPDEKTITTFRLKNISIKTLSFHYSLRTNNLNAITKIYEIMTTIEKGDTLILLGFSLLTQFNIGIFYTLAHTFEHVKMHLTEELGCIITLSDYVDDKNVIECLENILDASKGAESKGNIVLSIVPIVKLYEDKMYYNIVESNHTIMKYFAQNIRRSMNK